jgi:2-haloalkanoic acid dehalogenase type II
MRYKALLLDFYGTLVADDDRVSAETAQAIAEASPLASDARQVGRTWYGHIQRLCDAAYGKTFRTQRQIEIDSLTLLLEHYQARLDRQALTNRIFAYWETPDVFPDGHEFAEYIRQKSLPVCIASNIDTGDLESALRHAGWQFPNRVTSEDCRSYKPRPEMFERALTMIDCQPDEVLHVGDSWTNDVRGAQALGIDVAWVNRDRRPIPDQSAQPTFVVADLRELYKVIEAEA